MKYGLSSNDISLINSVFAVHPKVREVIIFGSRAMGNYKPGSDIDLAIIGQGIQFDDILQLHADLENLGLLNQFDLQRFDAIEDPSVLDHIRRVGKPFYNKQ